MQLPILFGEDTATRAKMLGWAARRDAPCAQPRCVYVRGMLLAIMHRRGEEGIGCRVVDKHGNAMHGRLGATLGVRHRACAWTCASHERIHRSVDFRRQGTCCRARALL